MTNSKTSSVDLVEDEVFSQSQKKVSKASTPVWQLEEFLDPNEVLQEKGLKKA